MAKKKKSGAAARRVQAELKALGAIEKDLAKIRANLQRFLNQVPVASGPESIDRRRRKMLREWRRHR